MSVPSPPADGPAPDFAGLVPPVVVACSGGPDSVALLALAADAGLDPVAVHVDHGIRIDSAEDVEVVAEVARRLGVPSRSVRVAVGPGPNLEARARAARYAALRVAAQELGASAILVAHTADDQAETVLLNVLRGAATSGLSGMPVRRDGIVRPLLALRRDHVRSVASARGLPTVDDPTNRDLRWRRAWIRHEVLPMLGEGSERDLVPVLARQAALLRAESDLLDELGDALLAEAGGDAPSTRVLRAAPIAVARRALRRWLGAPPPSADEIERVIAVVEGRVVATELAGGRGVRRSHGRLHRHGGGTVR
ncbi:MAG: tRNA lysidine(34) synthetase TilS [Acidimicrobiia bacterium]